MCDEKWILYNNRQWPAQWLDWEVLKHIPKPNLHQKRSRSLPGGLLPVWSTTAFWILANHYIWEARSANQWDTPKSPGLHLALVHRKGPSLLHDNAPLHITQLTLQKLKDLGFDVLLQLRIHLTSCQLTTTSSSISTTCCREKTSITRRDRKIFPRVFQNSKHTVLCHRNK